MIGVGVDVSVFFNLFLFLVLNSFFVNIYRNVAKANKSKKSNKKTNNQSIKTINQKKVKNSDDDDINKNCSSNALVEALQAQVVGEW